MSGHAEHRRAALAAAVQLVAESGMGWSMTDLALRAGVSRGAVYRCWKNKAGLLSELLGEEVTAAEVAMLASIRWPQGRLPRSLEGWRLVLRALRTATGGGL